MDNHTAENGNKQAELLEAIKQLTAFRPCSIFEFRVHQVHVRLYEHLSCIQVHEPMHCNMASPANQQHMILSCICMQLQVKATIMDEDNAEEDKNG